ncbi:Hypothetical protein A7982_00626 [Minicystis rosea]|nr:Hypothetical protein A7982_00626 [Minicystis rosea]
MKIVKHGTVAVVIGLVVGLFSLAESTGCNECDMESRCLQKEGLIVQTQIYPVCGVDPTNDGDRYSWSDDTGVCSCTLASDNLGQFSWHGCAFDKN